MGIFASLCASAAPTPDSETLVCWDDETGIRVCGDSVPPRYAKSERRVLDAQGRKVKTLPREATAEELATRRQRAQAEAEARRISEEQAVTDRRLLETYGDPAGVLRARNERLAALDARAATTEKALAESKTILTELRGRKPAATDEADAGAKLQKQIGRFEVAQAQNGEALRSLAKDRDKVCDNFARDLSRMQQLSPVAIQSDGACPPRARLSP